MKRFRIPRVAHCDSGAYWGYTLLGLLLAFLVAWGSRFLLSWYW